MGPLLRPERARSAGGAPLQGAQKRRARDTDKGVWGTFFALLQWRSTLRSRCLMSLVVAFGVYTSAAAQHASPLRRAYLRLDDVSDSGRYYVYRYRVVNFSDGRVAERMAFFHCDFF